MATHDTMQNHQVVWPYFEHPDPVAVGPLTWRHSFRGAGVLRLLLRVIAWLRSPKTKADGLLKKGDGSGL